MPETSSAKQHIDTSADGAAIIDQILAEGAMVRGDNPAQKQHARDIVGEFCQQILDERDPADKQRAIDLGAVAAIQDRINEIDEIIGKQLDVILHAAEFQSLEARWRGLHYLVMNTETSTRLKIRVMNVRKDELRKDFESAPDFDRSALFKKVYEEEYGTFGGAPYGLLLGDYEFDGSSPDVGLLTELSKVAAAAHAPFISAASPFLFDMENFGQIGVPGDLAKLFESTQLIKWREFRESEDSRYVGLVLPHVLMRLPYGPKGVPVDGFMYEENVGAEDKNFLWGNAAYALGQRITNAFAHYGWCAAIRGVEGGGLVENLPVHVFKTSDGDLAVKTPTEVAITDRRENELSELGFIGLCYRKNSGQAAFFGGATANKPKVYNLPSATANARLSAQLPYIMATSRFAHYIKVMMRDKIGSFMTKDNVSSYLNNWIADYVLLNDDAGQDTKARLPLREARIDVTDVPGKPGAYRAVVFLKPHFQLNELTVSMRLVADLPPPAA
ncbi:type VI secretion system contractile sheath large subunit [Polyangium spumosum]|uniref:Type VI secretion system contractile sheath large subunit n=1 Tax=Polyangium spumosum TaxID=889282 RepID=A0A6N7Q0K3_9BACT|nr:type VI secretion system contractile sheath large subunit [Polyangium spumosum]MRG95814.1 type VI secretion system contractile sheath large subunit [Polyangium spumosum]